MWTLTLCIFIATLILIILFLNYVKTIKVYQNASKIPGPKPLPFIGNADIFIGKDITQAFLEVCALSDQYPSPYRIWMLNHLLVGVYEAEQIKEVLSNPKCMEKSEFMNLSKSWFGTALIIAPVSIWRVRRKLIRPSFNAKILQSFMEVFNKHSKILVQNMKRELNNEEFKLYPYSSAAALNIAVESALGISQTLEPETFDRFSQCVNRGLKLLLSRFTRFWLHPNIIYKFSKMSKEYNEYVKWLHATVNNIIRTKQEERLKENQIKSDGIKGQKKGFLDLLLELQDENKISSQDISDETNAMIIAATDTVSRSLEFAILMLASFPDVQDKVYHELVHIYGTESDENTSVKFEDLQRMVYMERVIKETLRLFPPVSIILRQTQDELQIGEHMLPKGATIFLPIIALHRDDKYWSYPLKFDPDRFLPEETAKRNPHCYIPFSSGPRNCIGSVYAMMEIKTILATILRNYIIKKEHIVPINNIKIKLEIFTAPSEPVTIQIEKRVKTESRI